jgi:hypothetical protein
MKKIRGDEPSGVIMHTYMEISQGNSLCSSLYLKLKCPVFRFIFFFSYKIGEQETEQSLPRGEGRHQLEGGVLQKEGGRMNMVQ